jgi:hypothetical protein
MEEQSMVNLIKLALAAVMAILVFLVIILGAALYITWNEKQNVTPTPSVFPTINPSLFPSVTPTPGPEDNIWILKDCGMDKVKYAPGESATVYAVIENKQGAPITDINLHVTVYRRIGEIAIPIPLPNTDYDVNDIYIRPGTQQKLEYVINIPANVSGISTVGDYEILAIVSADGSELGRRTVLVTIG